MTDPVAVGVGMLVTDGTEDGVVGARVGVAVLVVGARDVAADVGYVVDGDVGVGVAVDLVGVGVGVGFGFGTGAVWCSTCW